MDVVMSSPLGPGLSHTKQGMEDHGKCSCFSGSSLAESRLPSPPVGGL